MSSLAQRLAAGEIILLDGATGTEIQRRGVPMDDQAWSATAMFTHPDVVQAVHEDYIRAGADVIVANTFGTGHLLLERAGLGGRVRELNLKAAELAIKARAAVAADRPVAVAGSVTIWSPASSPEATRADLNEQAALLAEGGVDLIALEMMEDVAEATMAMEAAKATGLPVWLGLNVKRDANGAVVLGRSSELLKSSLDALLALGGEVVSVMHSLPEVTGEALQIIRQKWAGPLGAYAHMGEFTMPNWQWVNMLTPDEYADEVEKWIATGTRAMGKSCGLGPEYIEVLQARFRPGK